MIKIEINYSLRAHVLRSEDRVFVTDAFGEPIKVRTVAAMEIFAAKTNALISRAAARNLYDFCNIPLPSDIMVNIGFDGGCGVRINGSGG